MHGYCARELEGMVSIGCLELCDEVVHMSGSSDLLDCKHGNRL